MECQNNALKVITVLVSLLSLIVLLYYTDEPDLVPNSPTASSHLPRAILIPINMTGRCFITYELANFPFGRRLGNHIFDTAAILAIAHVNNMTALLPKGARVLLAMEVMSAVIVSDVQYDTFMNKSSKFKEINNRIYDNRTKALPCNVTLDGFYQSWRYLVNYTDTIRRLIHFKPSFKDRANELFKKHNDLYFKSHNQYPDVTVGIHARLGFAEEENSGYRVAPPSYYQKAMDYFRKIVYPKKKVSFIVSSDKITWCKENIKGPDVFYSEAKEPPTDMALQSLCNDTITSLGSFSWWCAFWAGGNHVTYYKDWVRPGSSLEKQVNQSDMFYPNWVAIS